MTLHLLSLNSDILFDELVNNMIPVHRLFCAVQVLSDSQSAVWYPSTYENSTKTAANIFPPRQDVMGCMYSHNRINQAVFVIVIYLGLS